MENLHLSYDGTQVINGLSEQIPAHKMSVIFGPSGSRKSSLLDAILCLTPYQTGHIHIDNIPLEQIDIKAWRQMIGYVPGNAYMHACM